MGRVLLLTSGSAELEFLLSEEGIETTSVPLVPDAPDSPGLRAAAEQLHRLTWIIAVDRHAARALAQSIHRAGARSLLKRVQVLAGDLGSAGVLERLEATVRIPGDVKWAAAVQGLLSADDEVLIVHTGPAPEVLVDSLEQLGCAAQFVELPPPPALELPPDATEAGWVLVHSLAAADAWVDLSLGEVIPEHACVAGDHVHRAPPRFPQGRSLRAVASSQDIAQALTTSGLPVAGVCEGGGTEAVVEALVKVVSPG